MRLLKVVIRILCFLIIVGVVLTGVFFRENSVNKIAFNSDIFYAPVSKELHQSNQNDFALVAQSGFIELYFNKITSEIAVRELTQNYWWHAMQGDTDSMVAAEVVAEKGLYLLNSQDNSVAFSSWKSEVSENGVTITYQLTPEKDTPLTPENIVFEVALTIQLKDGSLFVDCRVKNLSGNEDCSLSSLKILPGLCSIRNPGKEDFLLIPDGCGAVIYPALCEEVKEFETKVYGNDYSADTKNSSGAIMGAFGVKAGKSAVAVIIDNGEEIAAVKAVGDKTAMSSVFADFRVCDSLYKNDDIYLSGNSYSDEISLCYKFLSGDNATYSEIASSCREQYIRNGSLPSTDVQAQESVPLYLTLTGAYKSSAWSPVNVKYTTYSQALDILSRVKSKGVDNLAVRYSGAMKNNSTSFASSLGSKNDFEDLCDFADSQNIDLFMDADILSYPSFFGKFDFSAVKSMTKSTAYAIENKSPDEIADNSVKVRFRKSSDISSFVADLIKIENESNISGYCIGDGEYLVSDYSAHNVSRGRMKKEISAQLPALSNAGGVMVDKGNMYMLKNSAAVINIPMTTYYDESECYVAVPFVQSVLHGRVIIAGTPINVQDDLTKATLQCIEYGVCLSFTTVYSHKNQKNNVLFDNVVNDLVSCYNTVAEALFALECERITAHDCLADGVYLTTYGDAAKIYVNYNDKPVTVSGVTIPANSYLRID